MLTSTRVYVCIKQTIYQNLRNQNRNTFSFMPHVCYFSHLAWILEFKNTLLYQNEGGRNSHKNINIHLPSIASHLPTVKTIKILRLIRKFKRMRDTYIDQGLCIFLMWMLKTLSILLINSELVIILYSVWLLSNL